MEEQKINKKVPYSEVKQMGNRWRLGRFILFIVFLCLKLTETITWSWWIVTLPLWIGLALCTTLIIITMLAFFIAIIIALIVEN
jgi:hypothetical protein